MDIKQAKEEIKKAIGIYLEKDEYGEYLLPIMKQRPVFMIGAPGIGKTAIVEQIAEELDIGLVAYSMTHHTRQSAIGLPYIAEHDYGAEKVRVSEYTMSEILASVYHVMEQSGKKEGILFLDEINCVSETLAPAILQFLQYKTFGNHALPKGWIIVSAGNPPQYNRAVREFDIATRDRLRYLYVEENLGIWKQYAHEHGVHGAILAFLEVNQKWFYSIRTTEEGPCVATARGWEDLSFAIRLYEKKGYEVDVRLIIQYITDMDIARKFSVFYDLYKKYREEYQIETILDGSYSEEILKKAKKAAFDERISLIEMISEKITAEIMDIIGSKNILEDVVKLLRSLKKLSKDETLSLAVPMMEQIEQDEEELRAKKAQHAVVTTEMIQKRQALQIKKDYVQMAEKKKTAKEQFQVLKKDFDSRAKKLAGNTDAVRDSMESVFHFTETAWDVGQEMTYFVTLLTGNRYCAAFIQDYGCESYYKYNDSLLLYDVHEKLKKEIMDELNL